MKKQNCWEVTRCGRESEGVDVGKYGQCSAAIETRLHGTN